MTNAWLSLAMQSGVQLRVYYTDPAARAGARFLAGLNALGRLRAVGSEWGSYASPIGGAAGRGLAREVAEEASETIGKQFARQAARKTDDEWVHLYRAVSPEELEDIMKTGGRLRVKPGQMEGKWFTTTPELAARWGKKLYRRNPYEIIEVGVPKRVLDRFYGIPRHETNRSIIFLVRNTSHRYKEESGITHAYHLALAVDPLSRTIKTAMHGRRVIRPRWVPIDSSPFWWWQR